MGKIIIVESSTAGCGKETQTKKLFERLKKEAYGFFYLLLIARSCKSTNITMSNPIRIATHLVVGVSFNGMNNPI